MELVDLGRGTTKTCSVEQVGGTGTIPEFLRKGGEHSYVETPLSAEGCTLWHPKRRKVSKQREFPLAGREIPPLA